MSGLRLKIAFLSLLGTTVFGQNSAINGFIKDADTAESLPYVNVVLQGSNRGTTTDERGYFVLKKLPPGSYTLQVSFIGYQLEEREVELVADLDLRLDLDLLPEDLKGEEVLVTADRTRFEKAVEVSRVNLSTRELEVVPAFVEADVFRSIQMLPGVVAQNDFSAALVVRGGSPDENLILLDGIEVYNPYHFGGIFSAFNTDAISNAEFQAGGFPVRYGGRLSSILEISTKEGSPQGGKLGKHWPWGRYFDLSHGAVNISLLSSKAFLEGPLYNGGWIFSIRRTYFDKVAENLHSINDTIPTIPYFFYDFQSKVHTQITPKHRLDINGYSGSDDLTLNFETGGDGRTEYDFDLNWIWGNRTNSFVLKSVINPSLFAETMIAQSVYDFDVKFTQTVTDTLGNSSETDFIITNTLKDKTLDERLDWKMNDDHRVQFGLEFKQLAFKFRFTNDGIPFLDQSEKPQLLSFYLQDTWSIGPLLNVQLGFRTTDYSLSDRLWTDLRAGFKYRLFENTALKFSTGNYTQFIFTSNNDDELLRIVDFWLPVPEYLDPQQALHFIAGIEHWLGNGNQLSLEVYYKPYHNLLDNNPIQSIYDDKDDFIAGTGLAYGFETIWKRSTGRLSGWLSYTYSHIEKRIDLDSNGEVEEPKGEIYPPKYDKEHNFKMVLNYELSEKRRLGLSWTISSGQPYTPVVGKMYGGSSNEGWFQPYLLQNDISGSRNSAFFPQYNRGDISYSRTFRFRGADAEFQAQILNVLNHFNVLLYQWDHSELPVLVTATSMFPIMPTIGLTFTF